MTRTKADAANSNRRNESKYAILQVISYAHVNGIYLTPAEIASQSGLSLNCVKAELCRLVRMYYLFRRQDNRRRTRNWYVYGRLKNKGARVLRILDKLHEEGKPLKIKR